LTTTLLFGGATAFAGVAVGDSGNTHDAVWRVTDIGLCLDKSLFALTGASDAVTSALATWEGDARLPRVWPAKCTADALGYRPGQDNRNTVRYAADGEPLAKGALAITLVSYDSDTLTIYDGDVVLNGIYNFADNSKSSGQGGNHSAYDLGDVLAHEFGHWFGLPDDKDDSTAIMYPYFDPGATRRTCLSDGDKQALDKLYASGSSNGSQPSACSIASGSSRFHTAIFGWAGIALVCVLQVLRRRVAGGPQ
jgi:hypothetical protein